MLFDVDVVGGLNIKKYYGDNALAVFVQPPSVEVLRERLVGRATDSEEMIEKRLAKAEWEMEFAPKFDVRIVNDNLDEAVAETIRVVTEFLS
jgi:guanylate kinase